MNVYLMLIAHAQTPPMTVHAGVYSWARGLHFGLSLHLNPYFMYAISESQVYLRAKERLHAKFSINYPEGNKISDSS